MAAVAVVLATACGAVTSKPDDPFKVAGMRVTDGPSGLRAGAPKPSRTVTNTDGGPIDTLAVQAVSDVEDYWKGAFNDTFGKGFTPVRQLVSWDAKRPGAAPSFCRETTSGLVNAAFCPLDGSIGWDRGTLLPSLKQSYGEMAVAGVLAHEYGHAVQHQAEPNRADIPTLVAEQQADCFAGAYMRWVASGDSRRFMLSTGNGLNALLASVISFRDPPMRANRPASGGGEHGSAFERVSAFQFGFTDGPRTCKGIDAKEVTQRRGDLPVQLQRHETGDWPVSQESVKAVIAAMKILFRPARQPTFTIDAAVAAKCPNARPTAPASFCPATNTIAVDLPALKKLGSPSTSPTGLTGDNTAYSVLISRYMLAVQYGLGMSVDTAQAGLRTACLTGVATRKLAQQVRTPDGNTVALTAGDLDEAVVGLLTNGLAASDINGQSAPASFARIDAFRTGVLSDQERCFKRFP
ncbi:neutral zinc metallopeptidase [Mycobacterium sp. OTB74]|uniref:neutral zinc metallopeptidase n=1 Tax=Mycobacterium sp. OTB74 TaxID=1853452 RepID=UPI0024732F8D|nr:neutral zinc metallopeptidase [Mycobacterium sp. OTB74]MDH6247237.1 putative metalloprotease [Mycobacterium sp. OTB74]